MQRDSVMSEDSSQMKCRVVLEQQTKELQTLSKGLLMREGQVLNSYKNKLKQTRNDNKSDKYMEKRALLHDSSDEDEDECGGGQQKGGYNQD